MKNGAILLESLIFLILSFILFSIVISVTSTLTRNQQFIERGSKELSEIISISNIDPDDVPQSKIDNFKIIDETGGKIVYEYKSSVTGETFRIGDN